MPGIIPPPTPPGRLGWDGQTALLVPKTGLSIAPGAGLIGRTDKTLGKLYIDAANASVAEPVHFFAPGAVAAKTVGKWRNRRAAGNGTLAVMEANLLTAPTAGDVSNFWRVLVTDSLGNTVQLPISTSGKAFYDLNQLANNAVVSAGTYLGAGGGSTSSGGNIGRAHKIVPTQNLSLAGASIMCRFVNNNTNVALAGKRCRFTLLDANFNVLASAIAFTSGSLDNTVANGGNEQLTHNLDEAVQLLSGVTYYACWDFLLDWNIANGWATATQYVASWGQTTSNFLPATSATVDGVASGGFGINANAFRDLNVDTGTNAFWNNANGQQLANVAAVNALTWAQVLGGTAAPGVVAPQGTVNGFLTSLQSAASVQAGAWSLNGSPSGVAPSYGDLTVSLSAVGAPAAGAAGADLNVRLVMLP